MSNNNFFGDTPVYIINLLDSYKRKEHILNQFKNFNANIEFIEAVDGRNQESFKNNYNISYNSNINFTTSLIAVICSHAKAIYKAYTSGYDRVCIFEDDVHLDLIHNCNFTLNYVCNLNNEWEAIQLFYIENLEHNYVDFIHNGLRLIKREKNYSGTCYVMNRIGMEHFLKNVVITDGKYSFNILKSIIDPEYIVFCYINSFIINRVMFYYYFETMTFDKYTSNENDEKNACQIIQFNAKETLLNIYVRYVIQL